MPTYGPLALGLKASPYHRSPMLIIWPKSDFRCFFNCSILERILFLIPVPVLYLILESWEIQFEVPNIFILSQWKVPMGGEERMAEFPPLVAEEITLEEGLRESEAVADIKFSSAGNFTPSTV